MEEISFINNTVLQGSFISYRTAHNLGFIDMVIKHIQDSPQVSDELMKHYILVLCGIGKLMNARVKYHIDESLPSTPESICPNQLLMG